MLMSRPLARLFWYWHEKLAFALLLTLFGCFPALCQETAELVTWKVETTPSLRLNNNACFLPHGELCASPASADAKSMPSRSSEGAFRRPLRRFGRDQEDIYSAPFHRSNLKWDALFLGGTGIMIATDSNASRALPGNTVNVSRNISNVGLYGTSAAAGVLWLSGMATHNEHARETGALSAEAFANALPFYVGVQLISGRQRPNEGNGNGLFGRNNALSSSFPSGHALFTWSMASVIAHEYPRPWVKWLVYGTATAASVTRFSGREHFPSDMVVGSVIGYLIGRHIFQAHCREGLSEGCPRRRIAIADQP
jgi:membrane-associated phospholipid phosphatase